jgi:hypothetical protein
MAVGRISGPLLKQNLLRQGVDLAFETDLLYLDVNNQRIGVNNSSPQYDLDVGGTTRSPLLEVTNNADIGSINITGNTISTSASTLALGTADNVVYQNRLTVDYIDIEGNRISSNATNANIELRPNGTGSVEVYSNMNVTGDIYATGNITADGEISIGDANTDFIEFLSEVNSDIIPADDDTYNLGGDPTSGGKQWADVYVQNFFAGTISTTGLEVDGIDITLRQGNIFYVAENGDDTYSGTHQNDPYASVAQALSQATAGDTVHIYPGVYTETFPLTIPAGVTVRGESIRSVTIQPTLATQDQDAFLLNGETTVEELSVKGFYYNVGANTGHAFRFANNMEVTSRSPYIRNVTVITEGSTTTVEDPRGFNTGDAGRGAYLDGSVVTTNSREAGCLFHAVTFITPGVDAVTFTNGVRIEWLNCFTYFANRGVHCLDGATGKAGDGKTALRVDDVSNGPFIAGETVEYYDTDGVTLIASGTIETVDADGKFYIDGKSTGFQLPSERIGKTAAANGNAVLDTSLKKFGTASLSVDGDGYVSIASQNDFGFGTDNFTVEFWVYLNSVAAVDQYLVDFRAGSAGDVAPAIYTNNGDIFYYTDSANRITGSSALTVSTWHHIALTKSGTDTKLFVDGSQVGSTYTDNNNYGSAKPLFIAGDYAGANLTDGYFDDFRVLNGTAAYTAGFTAPITTLYSTQDTVLLLRFNGDDSSVVFVDETTNSQDIRFSGGATATEFTLVDYTDFGAEVRMIGSASVYGNFGIVGNGPGVIVYAIGQNLAYIGNGKEVTNDPTTVIQGNEVVELNNARVRYNSVDHRGDFRVGDLFYVNQETGQVTFSAANFNVDTDTGLTFTDGVNTTTILADKIETGNWRISGNTVETLSGDANFTAASDQINFTNNVNIDGNLDVTGNLTIGGDIVIGDENTDSIEIVAGINSNIVPATNSTYTLGTPSLYWQNVYANELNVDDIKIRNNYITTTASNADLELRANGTGVIRVDNLSFDNYTITSTNDIILSPTSNHVEVDTTGAIKIPSGDTASRPATEEGLIRYNTDKNAFEGWNGSYWIRFSGVIDLDEDTQVTAELTPGANDNIIRFDTGGTTVVTIDNTKLSANRITVDDIEIDTNVITTIATDEDLYLEAQGTGSVVLENFAFTENSITNVETNGITLFQNTGNGYLKVNGTNGFVLPTGNNTNRPDPAFTETGMVRFNTADGRVEAFDGQQWGSVAGQTGAITRIDAEYLAVETVLYLG